MTDLRKAAEMAACEVPLHELLEGVPESARLVIDSEDGMSTSFIPVGLYCKRAAKALRQALAKPVDAVNMSQERVDETTKREHEPWCDSVTKLLLSMPPQIPPCNCKPKREWVGLTDAQVEKIAEYHGIDGLYETSRIDFYRAIEITLKELNT